MKKNIKHDVKVVIMNNSDLKTISNILRPTIIELNISGMEVDFNLIPDTVHTLKFNYDFDNLLCKIPPSVKSVYFYKYLNLLDELPNTIINIEIYTGFNQYVDNLHYNLISLNFGWSFNQCIDNLPLSLEKIILGFNFIHQINNLPSNVKFLYISNPEYNYSSIKKFPKSLVFLQFSVNEDFDLEFNSNILNNKKYAHQLEKNYGVCSMSTYSRASYFKNYYFYNI